MTFCKALRRARSIIALIMRVGEGASVAERAAGKVFHDKAHVVGRRVDFFKGGEELACVWLVWEDCKGEHCTFARKLPASSTQEG